MSLLAMLIAILMGFILNSGQVRSVCPRSAANGTYDGLALQRIVATNFREPVSLVPSSQ